MMEISQTTESGERIAAYFQEATPHCTESNNPTYPFIPPAAWGRASSRIRKREC